MQWIMKCKINRQEMFACLLAFLQLFVLLWFSLTYFTLFWYSGYGERMDFVRLAFIDCGKDWLGLA